MAIIGSWIPGEETITIPLALYNDLMRDSRLLNALRGAGVDNWDGYDEIDFDYLDDEE